MSKSFRALRRRVFFRRLYRKLLNMSGAKREPLSPVQLKAIAIIRKLISNENSILLISPISNTHHIEHGNILVRFSENDCHIMNSKYSYYVYLPAEEANELSMFFRRKMETRTNKVISAYEKKTLQSLQYIIEDLEKPKTTEFRNQNSFI